MRHTDRIESIIRNFFARKRAVVKTTTELDKRIIDEALLEQEKSKKTQLAAPQPNIWRIIMKSRITKLTAAAVIIIVLMLGINYLGTPINGASTVFAAAMDNIKQARTFSCTRIFEVAYEGEGKDGKYFSKEKIMFKEPYRERRVQLTSPWSRFVGEICITDFKKRQELTIRPAEKTASLHDKSSDYYVNDNTGELKLTQLNTSLRDRLLKWTMDAVEDLGSEELDGKSVRKLQSQGDDQIITVWINPKTNMPVQIELNQLKYEQLWMYESIQIDTELDDNLFSLEPPEGYTFKVFDTGWPDDKKKMGAKIMHLGKLCLYYANKHDNQFPSEFVDLVTSGITTDEVLKKVLAAPEEPNGPSVFRYRQPDTDAADWSIEVMLYEVFDNGLGDGRVVVTMLDSHSELVPVQTLVQLLKPWPEHKKKLSLKMTHLHWLCDQYAKEHEGRYPGELKDLIGGRFSDKIIKRLQAAPDQPDGPPVIRYRPPRANADPSTEVILFEIYDQWPEDNAVVCYADGHCEIIPDQNRFEELIR